MQIQLVRAWPHRHQSLDIELGTGACVGDALVAAGWNLDDEFVALAVFGVAAKLNTPLHEGDRIELLRALPLDPMTARRRRAGKS